jgi:hypothetical protein
MKAPAATILAAMLLSACSTILPRAASTTMPMGPGAELVGQTVRLETAAGQASTLHFANNGVVHARFGSQSVQGNWIATNGQLCFSWVGTSRECWPYTSAFARGQTVNLTSDLGNKVRVTLQ